MLNYQNIISSLKDEQKIEFIADIVSLDDSIFSVHNIPKIKVGYVGDYCKELYPKPSVLANSYDRKLWEDVARQIALKMKLDGVNFAVSFGPKPKLSPLSVSEVSEDVYISVEMSSIFAKELGKAGIIVGLDNCYLSKKDLTWIDSIPNRRFIAEAFVKPYLEVFKRSGACVLISHSTKLKGSYKDVNDNLQNTIINELNKYAKAFLVCVNSSNEDTVENINKEIICIKGSRALITSSFKDGVKLEEDLKNGTIDRELYDNEISKGNYLTSRLLDEATDRALEFLFLSSQISSTGYTLTKDEEELLLSKQSVLKSTVLLKRNDELLPLKNGAKISIIGDIAMKVQSDGKSLAGKLKEKIESSCKIKVESLLRGYDISKNRSESLLSKVDLKVKYSDLVLVFLGLNDKLGLEYSKNNRGILPANQMALVNELLHYKEKVVIVLSSEYLVGAKFLEEFSCVLFMPLSQNVASEALFDILTNKYSPNAKLSTTLYDSFEKEYLKKAHDLKKGKKVGPLFGYREYVSVDLPIKYHFGYGLSFNETKYKRLKVKDGKVKVKVKNKSKIAIDKIVQVYVGLNNKTRVEPRYTLCGFERVHLKPRSKKAVTIEVTMPYTYFNDEFIVFNYEYNVYAGNSSKTANHIGKIKKSGNVLDCKPNLEWLTSFSDTENLVDYYESISNIRENNFMLEAKREKMKRSKKNLIVALGSIVMAIAILMFNSLSHLGALFLNILAGILAVTAIAFFILDINDRNKAYKLERKRIDDANKKLFDDAQKILNFDADKMFKDEFDSVSVNKEEEKIEPSKVHEEEDLFKYVDKNLTISEAVENYVACARERGVLIDKASASSLFASLVSSKLLFVDSMDPNEFDKFIFATSEYFGTYKYLDYAYEDTYTLEYVDENGNLYRSNMLFALEEAVKNKEKIYIVGIDNVKLYGFNNYFEPFKKYILNPKNENNSIKVGEKTYKIPENVWFIVNVSKEENVANLDRELSRSVTFNTIKFTELEVNGAYSNFPLFTYQQLLYLADKTVESVAVTEDVWKKFDKVESFISELNGSQFGNKMFRQVERQLAILVENENSINEAVDMVLSSKIVPYAFIELKDFNLKNEGFIGHIDSVFGEENVTYAHSKIETYSYNYNLQLENVELQNAEAQYGEYDSQEYQNYVQDENGYYLENGEYPQEYNE